MAIKINPKNVGAKKATKRIGFDFDKVFVSYPPIIPDKLIDFLYKGKLALIQKKTRSKIELNYRIPGKVEREIRVFSHNHIFRPPIKQNILALKEIYNTNNYEIYLVSSRFGFLKNKTSQWILNNKIKKYFTGIHFNYENQQPHLFKEEIIKEKKIKYYVDDDLDLLVYLSSKIPEVSLFWLSNNNKPTYQSLPKNIKIIKSVKELSGKI